MSEIVLTSLILVLGIIFITFSSDRAVKHASHLARALGISPLIIGVTLVSIGTDLSEIFNSIISSSIGHANINVGDSIGSVLTQITLVFGLLPLLGGMFKVRRKDVLILGACLIISLIVIYSIIEKGYITRINAIFMVGSLVLYFLIIYLMNKEEFTEKVIKFEIKEVERSKQYHALLAGLSFIGVTISAIMIVESVIVISSVLNVHEFIVSFFIVSIGTSLPELAVDVSALRRRENKIALGDIIGSCIVDATLSIGIGQVFFPQAISAELALPTIIYTIIASFMVFFILVYRKKVDKKAGIIFIILYFFSYVFIFIDYALIF